MRYILLVLFAALLPTGAAANDEARAEAFVVNLTESAISILTENTTRQAREEGFRKLLDEKANMQRIARFTLGQFYRSVPKEDFAIFQGLLNELIIKVYANRLGTYSNEKIVVTGSQIKRKNFIVNSKIVFANGRQPIDADWWLRREKDGRFTLFDVRVLGVWMAQEQRDSFASVLKNNKGDFQTLLSHLRKRIETGDAENIQN